MITPRQVVESFLQEQATIYAETNLRLSPLHTKYFGSPLLQQAEVFLLHDPTLAHVEEVNQSTGRAMVITGESAPRGHLLRRRYHLSAVDTAWKILQIDRECFLCHGAGRLKGVVCPNCEGAGWCDTTRRINVSEITKTMSRI